MKRFRHSIYLFFLCPFFLCAQRAEDVLNVTIRHSAFVDADLGIYIKNISSDKIIIAHHENKLMAPASILKIQTTSKALEFFGPSHRFKTSAYIVGEISDGILYGDVIVKGFGDPSFDSAVEGAVEVEDVINDIISFLRSREVTCVFGSVVVDASYFSLPGIPSGYIQEDIANYYGAGAYGMNIADNAYEIVFDRRSGKGVVIHSFDSIAVRHATHAVQAAGYSDQAYIYYHPDGQSVHIIGKIPAGKGKFKIKGAIKNPPKYCAEIVQRQMEKAGVEFHHENKVSWYAYAIQDDVLWTSDYYSPDLYTLLIPVMHKSNNVYAEVLFRHLKRDGQLGDHADYEIIDGSGLSPTSRISAKELMSNLEQGVTGQYGDEFISLFPKNGVNGTVRSVLSKRSGTLLIKSGSIGGVRTYMGMHKAKNGEWIGFVCMANELHSNGSQSRKAWEGLLAWIADL